MGSHLENEAILVKDAGAGGADAFTMLVQQYERHIYRLALHITGNREDAEEVLQATFSQAYVKLGQFEGKSRFYPWLVRIAVNAAVERLRRGTNWPVPLDDPAEGDVDDLPRELRDWGENPEGRYAQQDLQEILNEAMAGLRPVYRTAVVLRDIASFSTAETAALLNVSAAALKTRLLRGRLELRERLNEYFKRPVSARKGQTKVRDVGEGVGRAEQTRQV